jgi:ABC-type glycerol-3-phosphate transport system permease component
MMAGERPRLAGRALRFGLLSVAAAAIALPLVWILSASLRPQSQIFGSAARLTWDTFIPFHPVLENYLALPRGDFPRAVGNTAIVAGATVVLGILVNSLAGFALAQFSFRGRGLVLTLVVLSFMMPFEATVIPLYRIMRWFGWLDSYHVLVLPEVANGLVIFLFRQFFAGIPRAFFEAAQVDGASWFRQYRAIAMPLAWPTIATAVLMLFLVQWDAFFWPVVAASSGQYAMVQVTIARNINFEQNDWGGLFASTSLAIALGMIPFLALQRYYIRSLMESGLR